MNSACPAPNAPVNHIINKNLLHSQSDSMPSNVVKLVGQRSFSEKLETSGVGLNAKPLVQEAVDTNGKKIWTIRQFDTGWRNPLAVCKRGGWLGANDYVIDQWSTDYFIAGKKNISSIKTSFSNAWEHATLKNIFSTDFSTSKHVLNAGLVMGAAFANVELGNFLKGVGGIGFSVGKAVLHSGAALGFLGSGLLRLFCGETKHLSKALDQIILMFQDLLSILTCVGHAIPSWLPLALTLIFPHIGLAALAGCAILKMGSKFTGLSDLIGYGGTAGFLKAKALAAQKVLDDVNATPAAIADAQKVLKDWEHLKSELNPTTSGEGALLTAFGIHVVFEAALMPIEFFVPGFSAIAIPCFQGLSLVNAISWGIPAATCVGFAGYRKHKKRKAEASESFQN
jgi:hypothetical protein